MVFGFATFWKYYNSTVGMIFCFRFRLFRYLGYIRFWFDLVSQNTKNFWEYLDSINFVFDFGLVLGYLQLALDNQGLEAKSPRTVERELVSHKV